MCKITLGRILRNRDSFSNRARVSNCLAAEMLRHEFLTRCTCAAISIRPGRVERTDGRDGRQAPILMVIFKARCWIRERDLDCKRPLSTVMMEQCSRSINYAELGFEMPNSLHCAIDTYAWEIYSCIQYSRWSAEVFMKAILHSGLLSSCFEAQEVYYM